MVVELEQIRREIDLNTAEALRLCEGLDEAQLAWRPAPNKWSVAENLLHLTVTTAAVLPSTDHAIEVARQNGLYSRGPFSLGLMGRFFVWYVEPPPVIKLPAPKQLKPLLTGSATHVLPEFVASQRLMLERVERADGLDLVRTRFQSPFASFVRMNLLALFSVFTGHERRHLWQASTVLQALRTATR